MTLFIIGTRFLIGALNSRYNKIYPRVDALKKSVQICLDAERSLFDRSISLANMKNSLNVIMVTYSAIGAECLDGRCCDYEMA